MKNAICWTLTVLMILALCVTVVSPAMGDGALPLDQTTGGMPLKEENWTIVSGEDALTDPAIRGSETLQPNILKYDADSHTWSVTDDTPKPSEFAWMSYSDSTIQVRCEYTTVIPAKKKEKVATSITYIKIADPTQMRSAMSFDSYEKRGFVEAYQMARSKNAVVAVNGDFFKYHHKVGYITRQGVFYRDKLNGKRDLLIIDDKGDFHSVPAAKSADAAAAIAELEADGRTVINTFTLGPTLAVDGAAVKVSDTSTAAAGEFQWKYPQQRVAVVQTGELEYAIIETYGHTDGHVGLTLQEFADLIVYLFPDCRVAYNLDGGGSTNVIVKGNRIHKTPGYRDICDILYFASAEGAN